MTPKQLLIDCEQALRTALSFVVRAASEIDDALTTMPPRTGQEDHPAYQAAVEICNDVREETAGQRIASSGYQFGDQFGFRRAAEIIEEHFAATAAPDLATPVGVPVDVCMPIMEIINDAFEHGRACNYLDDNHWSLGMTYGDVRRFKIAVEAAQRGEQSTGCQGAAEWRDACREAHKERDALRAEVKSRAKEAESLRAKLVRAFRVHRERDKLKAALETMRPIIEHAKRNASVDWSQLTKAEVQPAIEAFDGAMEVAQ